MASAIRKAGDLREQTDDIRPFDGVMLWRDDIVYRFDVDYPDEDLDVEWDGRYCWPRTDSSDVYEMSRDEAKQMANTAEYVHLGSCPSVVLPSDAVPAEMDHPVYGPKFLFSLIDTIICLQPTAYSLQPRLEPSRKRGTSLNTCRTVCVCM